MITQKEFKQIWHQTHIMQMERRPAIVLYLLTYINASISDDIRSPWQACGTTSTLWHISSREGLAVTSQLRKLCLGPQESP